MIPEPNLWADLRDRDRSLDEVEYPPHHLEAVNNTRTLTLPRGNGNSNCNPRDPFLKEELELEPGHNHTGNGLHSGSAVTVSSAASMNNVNSEAEVMRQRQRWTRRWYLLVIVLLYIGLLASFSLNVSLLLRKPSVTSTGGTSKTSGSDVTSTGISSAANSALDNQGNSLTSSTDLQGEGRTKFTFFTYDSISRNQNLKKSDDQKNLSNEIYQFHVFFILCIFISESKSLISRENIFKIEIVKVDTHIHFTSFFGTYYF